MVTIRLSRHGAKKHAFYHIVVTESENARDGRFIEHIGTYDPAKPMTAATIDQARLQHWLSVGATTSPTLRRVLKEHKLVTAGGSPTAAIAAAS
jgi:small subunit ribosomal protein S16